MRFSSLFCLLVLAAMPFALVQWSALSSLPIAGKVAISGTKAIYAGYDGKLRAVSADTGAAQWIYDTGEEIWLEPQVLDASTVAVATSGGKLHFVSIASGKSTALIDLKRAPLSIASGDGKLFLAANGSVLAFTPAGKSAWNSSVPSMPGQLGFGASALYYTSGGALYAVSPGTGAVKWVSASSDAYLSRPSEYGGTVYFGATDGRLYALDYVSGRVKWSYKTGGWVMGTPVASSKSVYFGSSDGNLYSVSTGGNLNWKAATGGAVNTEPVLYQTSSGIVVAFGSDDGNVYALDTGSGQPLWSFSSYGKPLSASQYQGALLFGTSKGKVYSLSPSPICSFTYPPSDDAVGNWTVDVEGRASSQTGVNGVDVRVNKGAWIAASGTENWHASVDLSQLPDGAVEVECRARDSSGKQEASDFSFVTLIKSANVPLRTMYVIAPQSQVAPNETVTMRVQDARGHDLYGLSMRVAAGEMKNVDSPVSLVLGRSGQLEVEFEKSGFTPASAVLIGSGGFDFALVLIAVVLVALAIAIYFLFGRALLGSHPKK